MKKWTYANEEFGNIGTIEEVMIYPYKGATKKEKGYKVTAMSAYDQNFIYHVLVFESLPAAKDDLVKLCFDLETEIKEA